MKKLMGILILVFLYQSALGTDPLPDKNLTPGVADPAVTQDNIDRTICKPGYTATVRNVSLKTKKEVFKLYGIAYQKGYEVDHLISLELGGSNDIQNLWPEPYEPRPGAHEKDTIENLLHRMVCAKKMKLKDAQDIISTDWLSFWKEYHAVSVR